MYDHIGLHVSDLDASIRFYEAALAPLGTFGRAAGMSPGAYRRTARRAHSTTDD